jgi:hypothetical protein
MICDFAELFQGGFLVFDDFLGEHIGIGKAVGFFEAFVSEKSVAPCASIRLSRKESQTSTTIAQA